MTSRVRTAIERNKLDRACSASLLNKAGIHSRRRESAGDNGACPRQEAEIAYASPAGSRCHTCLTGCSSACAGNLHILQQLRSAWTNRDRVSQRRHQLLSCEPNSEPPIACSFQESRRNVMTYREKHVSRRYNWLELAPVVALLAFGWFVSALQFGAQTTDNQSDRMMCRSVYDDHAFG